MAPREAAGIGRLRQTQYRLDKADIVLALDAKGSPALRSSALRHVLPNDASLGAQAMSGFMPSKARPALAPWRIIAGVAAQRFENC
jgi:hypothetical protein